MLTFACLWMLCDREGRFEWRPKQLKLDILPFIPFDLAVTLELLAEHDFVVRYEVDGKSYGYIPSWEEHQHINVKESASIIPAPPKNQPKPVPKRVKPVRTRGEGEGEKEVEREREGEVEMDAQALPPLALAQKVAEELGCRGPGVVPAIGGAIDSLIKRDGKSPNSAVEFLIAHGKDARDRGEILNRFWFDDSKWLRHEKPNGAITPAGKCKIPEHQGSGTSAMGECWGCYKQRGSA